MELRQIQTWINRNASFYDDLQNVDTPVTLFDECISKINEDLSSKKILVLYNIEAVLLLIKNYKVKSENIYFFTQSTRKSKLLKEINTNVFYTDISNDPINYLNDIKMKFDVIIGNPPYQNAETDRKSNGGDNTKLWPIFLDLSMSLCKENGYVSIIIPDTWCSGAKNPIGKTNIFNDIVKKKQTLFIRTNLRSYFNKGIGISYLCIKNCDRKNDITILNNMPINLSNMSCIPKDEKSIGIFSKISNSSKFNFVTVRKTFDKSEFKNEKSSKYAYKTYKGRDGYLYVSDKTKYDDLKKVIVYRMGGKLIVDNIGEITPVYSQVYILNKLEIGEHLIDLFESKFYKFLISNVKYTQYNESRVFNALPKVDLSKSWTDAELYAHFNLTQEEIDYIESIVK